jgi:hypothetical protein
MSARGALGLVAAALLAAGCSQKLQGTLVENQRPEVRLSYAPASPSGRFFYSYTFQWFGSDPDGRVDHFIYAVDPPSPAGSETTWVRTSLYKETIQFRSEVPDSTGVAGRAVGFHVFVIKAVDDLGLASAPEVRSFFSYTEAPGVRILDPRPASLSDAFLGPTFRVTWDGIDRDGISSQEPVGYKYTLLSPGTEFSPQLALLNPDSLRRYYAPDFEGWTATDATGTFAQYFNLTPGVRYVFAVVAFDEAGAYSPQFDFSGNMLRFTVGFAGNLGPVIRFWNSTFDYTYTTGGYTTDPAREVSIDMIPNRTVQIRWSAMPIQGAVLAGFRWRLDGDLSDESAREDVDDISRWSTSSLFETSVTLGPFGNGEVHRLYLEAEDSNNIKSLGIVRFNVLDLTASFTDELLIVDDTRLNPDQRQGSCVRLPTGSWPMAAELDTFLYARGGVPWKCYPAGTMTTPGLFAGYDYDTMGTRSQIFPFPTLARYKRVLWLVDAAAARSGGGFFGGSGGLASLRLMSQGGNLNTLAAYAEAGGKVWLAGGGGAYASTNGSGQFVPGTFMYEFAKWQSRSEEAADSPVFLKSESARQDWPGAPDYSLLPAQIGLKSLSTDPFPPGRTGQSLGAFYRTVTEFEYILSPNVVTEDADPDPNIEEPVTVLDTLYRATALSLPFTRENPVMTYYYGSQTEPFIVTGFDLWSYKRPDLQALVDFVLGELWGMPKTAPGVGPGPGSLIQEGHRPDDRAVRVGQPHEVETVRERPPALVPSVPVQRVQPGRQRALGQRANDAPLKVVHP